MAKMDQQDSQSLVVLKKLH